MNIIDSFFTAIVNKMNSPLLIKISYAIGHYSDVLFILIVFIIAIIIIFSKKKVLADYYLEAVLGFTAVITYGLKHVFERPRPIGSELFETGFSFPSSHATISAGFFMALYLLFGHKIKNKVAKVLFIILCFLVPLVIAISRLTLGVHYFTDIVAGLAIGILIAFIIWKNIKTDKA